MIVARLAAAFVVLSAAASLAEPPTAAMKTATPSAAPEVTGAWVQKQARAFSLATAEVTGAAVLRAGEHIDVIHVFADPETKKVTALTLFQNVVVLANVAPASGEPKQLSLLVLPEEAELLALAKETGHLTVTLRNPEDQNLVEPHPSPTLASEQAMLRPPAKKK